MKYVPNFSDSYNASCILVFIPLLANAELSTKYWDNLKNYMETGGYQVIGKRVQLDQI